MHVRSIHISALVAVAAITFAACGDDSTEPAGSGGTTTAAPSAGDLASDLDGRVFLSQSTTGITLAPGAVLRIEFVDGRIAVSGGCNQMSGDATFEGDVLVVGPMMSTEMACDQALMDQDVAVGAFLSARPTVALAGDQLTLTGAAGTIELLDREVADPDRPLEGTTWTVTGVIANDAVSSGWGDAEAIITIVDGRAEVNAGCNTGSATATIEENESGSGTIAFGPLALTRMMCEEAAMQLETAVATVLDGTATYSIEADQLTLMNGPNGLTLRATDA